ncbi:hypothetical protein KCP75_13995 [Salmonella enterica subsp. enterica]|nr:hypothetical protein KCP75_13995 [Salmonella enterica subsp. enterica]
MGPEVRDDAFLAKDAQADDAFLPRGKISGGYLSAYANVWRDTGVEHVYGGIAAPLAKVRLSSLIVRQDDRSYGRSFILADIT